MYRVMHDFSNQEYTGYWTPEGPDAGASSQKALTCASVEHFFVGGHITRRNLVDTPPVDIDLYAFKGKKLGTSEARGILAMHDRTYILSHLPRALLMEQVPGVPIVAPAPFGTPLPRAGVEIPSSRHARARHDLRTMTPLNKAGYELHSRLLQTNEHGTGT